LKKKGYQHAFADQKTSLRSKCTTRIKDDCLSKSYDHFLFSEKHVQVLKKGIISFYEDFGTIKEARKVSDHLPIWVELN
jgi:hypothetical protein